MHVNLNEHFDVLAWWEKNVDAYPVLSLMARNFLVILSPEYEGDLSSKYVVFSSVL